MKSLNLLIRLMLLVFAFGIVSCSGSQDTGLTTTGPSELTISGTLENIYGYPVSGAEVALEQGGVVQASDVTDADGKYSFSVAPGDYELKIDGVGYLSKTVPISVMSDDPIPTQYVSVDLNTHGIINGKVTEDDQGGAPLSEVKVSADGDNYVSYTSDAGFFSITVPHGAVSVEFSKYAYKTVSSNHDLSLEEPFIRDNDVVLSIDTSTHGVVSGVASLEFGDGTAAAPIMTYLYVGSEVKYRQSTNLIDKITIVNDDASYRIVLPHGDFYDIIGVSIYHNNYKGEEFTLDSNNAFVDESYTLDLKTDKYGGIYGQVVDQFDAPLEGVNVTFNNGDSLLGSVVSDELGNFYAILDLGIYDVKFTKDGFENTIETADLDNDAFAYLPSVALNYASSDLYTLSGVITNSYGAAIKGVSVEVYSGTTLLTEDVTDDSGAYLLSLPSGTYSLNVIAATHEGITDHQVVMDDADLTLDFTLKSNGANLSACYHVLHIDDAGDLWTWGDHNFTKLGDNSTAVTRHPKNISKLHPDLDKFSMVSAMGISLGLDVNGKLYAWGAYGSPTPVEVDLSNLPPGEKIVKISADSGGALVTDKGTLLMWGYNASNQLGFLDTAYVSRPTVVPLANVQDVAISSRATFALTKDGDVYTWGSNYAGLLGIGDTDNGTQTHIPQLVLKNLKVVEISAGSQHFLALTDQGDLYGWGNNRGGELDGTGGILYAPKHLMSSVKTMSAGTYASHVVLTDGTVSSWGNDGPGDLSSLFDVVKLEGGHLGALAMTSDGRIYGWGEDNISGSINNLIPIEIVMGIKGKVSSGSTALYRNDVGELYSWGYNQDGQVGDGTTANVLYPKKTSSGRFGFIASGYGTSFAYDAQGQLWGWGSNSYGQIGDGSTVDRSSPVLVDMSGVRSVLAVLELIDISSSAYHTAAIASNRNLYTWGRSNYGQTGHSSDKLIPTLYDNHFLAIATTTYTTAALKHYGPVYTMGRNEYGLLGTDNSDTSAQSSLDYIPRSSFDGVVIEIVGGESHMLALTDNGTLYGWGNNGSKQLDNSSNAYYIAPHKLMENVRSMDAGLYSSYAVKFDGTVHSWGSDANNALGNLSLLNDKDILLISGGASGGKAISRDGKVYSWGDSFTTGTGYSSADPVDITDILN